ncbi:MAG: class I SAM-dependent methyltransferase [Catenulispora sp.]|nr:class I SAM-dependent methyltransferase [Catenulispora sp.]
MSGTTGKPSPLGATPRYDGYADWYESFNAPYAEANRDLIVRLLGRGSGPCLDLGCGTGLHFAALREAGHVPVGVDVSADQLAFARTRGTCVRANGATLPFADAAFPAVTMLWISTDVDDFQAVVREAARVLVPGGSLVFAGVHPCFMGPHIEHRDDGSRIVHPTYRIADWHEPQPWWTGRVGLRNRVGMRHVPLADLLQAFIDAGLVLETIVEPEPQHPVPPSLALRLRRPESPRH